MNLKQVTLLLPVALYKELLQTANDNGLTVSQSIIASLELASIIRDIAHSPDSHIWVEVNGEMSEILPEKKQ